MNIKETKQILLIYKSLYPNTFKNIEKEEVEFMSEIWQRKFNKYNYSEMNIVADRLSTRLNFMPSISEIIKELELMRNPHLQENAEEEWEKVLIAIRKGKLLNESGISERTKNVCKAIGIIKLMELEESQSQWVRKQFIEMFENKKELDIDVISTNKKSLSINELKRLSELDIDTSKLNDIEMERLLNE